MIWAIKKSCACEALSDVDGFDNISDFNYLKSYIEELIITKDLFAKRSFKKHDRYGHKKFLYKCPICKNVWTLTEPGEGFKGNLKKYRYITLGTIK